LRPEISYVGSDQSEADCHDSTLLVPEPPEVTHKPFQLASVDDTLTANLVIGEDVGLPLELMVIFKVDVVAPDNAGAPGMAADV